MESTLTIEPIVAYKVGHLYFPDINNLKMHMTGSFVKNSAQLPEEPAQCIPRVRETHFHHASAPHESCMCGYYSQNKKDLWDSLMELSEQDIGFHAITSAWILEVALTGKVIEHETPEVWSSHGSVYRSEYQRVLSITAPLTCTQMFCSHPASHFYLLSRYTAEKAARIFSNDEKLGLKYSGFLEVLCDRHNKNASLRFPSDFKIIKYSTSCEEWSNLIGLPFYDPQSFWDHRPEEETDKLQSRLARFRHLKDKVLPGRKKGTTRRPIVRQRG